MKLAGCCLRQRFAALALGSLAAFAALALAAHADEVYSNRTGGGDWSDPATWKGGAVPKAEDDVVIASDDIVVFDRDDSKAVTCAVLALDPRSVLQFKQNAGPIVMCIRGASESYGTIKLDASKSAKDEHELRLMGETPDDRMLKISKGGGLVVAGRAGLAKGKRNARLVSQPPAVEPPKDAAAAAALPPVDPTGTIDAQTGTTLDVQRASVINLHVIGTGIDNTGAKVGERLNIIKNHFTGGSWLTLTSCDTALIADNLFERTEPAWLQPSAMYISACPLAEIRGNTIRGTYYTGFTGYGQSDSSLTDTSIEGCYAGMYYYGSNAMIKRLYIKNCSHGMTLTSMSGALEDVTIDGYLSGYHNGPATAQLTNLVFLNRKLNAEGKPDPNGYDIHFTSGQITLLNCDIKQEQITIAPNFEPAVVVAGKQPKPVVQSLNFLVAKIVGTVPNGFAVEVKTNPPAAAGATDPNVRNSPARVQADGMTPLPRTLEPLVLRSWMFDPNAKPVAAPAYQLNVLGPVGADGMRTVLKSVPIPPTTAWYRKKPNDKQPTLEVTFP